MAKSGRPAPAKLRVVNGSPGRGQLRAALRWQRDAAPGRIPPPRVHAALDALTCAAIAEVRTRERLGLSWSRTFEFCGVVFSLRCTSWQRLILTDTLTGVSVVSRYGAL